MEKYLKKLPREILDLIYAASNIAAQDNTPVYLVGGFVRDLLLGVSNLDLDIVVEGNGIKFAELYSSALKAKLTRHRRFNTASVNLAPHLKIDITTARKEFYPQPASLPVVESGNLRNDLARRDFSINAMAISINPKNFGKFIDFFNGRGDLRNKKIRVLHNLSFIDDPTRLLRAIRFEQRYNFRIEPQTLSYLKEAVRLKMLGKVQPQRLRDELILLLKEAHPIRNLRRTRQLTGLDFINLDLSFTKKTYNFLVSLEEQIRWFKKRFPGHRKLDTWLIYFTGLLGNLNINAVKATCGKFVFRKGEEKRILSYKKINRKFTQELSRKGIKPSRIFQLLEPLSYEAIILLRAKCKNKNLKKHIEDFFEIYNGMRLYISGDDLRRLGVAAGPYYQKIFTRVLNAKLNGLVRTQLQELALIKKIIMKK